MDHHDPNTRGNPYPSREPQADCQALREGSGLHLMASRIVVRLVGDDRIDFIHGMCSNDLKRARTGTVIPALFLTEHAHVIADFFAWITEEALLIEIESRLWPQTRAHLERFIVADDVEMEEVDGFSVIDIEGKKAAEAAAVVGGEGLKQAGPSRFVRAGSLFVGEVARFGVSAFSILAPAVEADRTVSRLLEEAPDCQSVSADTLEVLRVENGIARVGVDTAEKTIALEARLERAISLSKGCYVGQETIERATSRGGLKKRLCGLRIGDESPPPPGAPVLLDGREVGRMTSAVLSPRFGPIGLAILHHSAWEPGTTVQLGDSAGRVRAVVSELPFG